MLRIDCWCGEGEGVAKSGNREDREGALTVMWVTGDGGLNRGDSNRVDSGHIK